MKVILTPWKARLLMRFSEAKRIELVCPFIKLGIVRGIVASVRPGARISLVTRAKPSDFAAGASDIDALRTLFAAAETLGLDFSLAVNNTVHAKIFIFDDVVCYVGSSNLTASGLERSLEGTVEMTEAKSVLEWRGAFEEMQKKANPVTLHDLDEVARNTRKYLLTHKTVKVDEGLYYDVRPADNADVLDEVYRQVEATELPFLPALQERVDDIVEHQLDIASPEPGGGAEEAPPSPPQPSQDDILAGENPAAPVARNLSERKIALVRDFVALAQNSFDLPAWSGGISVAHSVIHPSVFDLIYNVEVEGRSLAIGRQVHSSLRQLGYDAFSLGLAILYVRSGLLTRYGPAFCSTLETAIRGNGFLQKTWQRRFLPDPVMSDTDEASMTVGNLEVLQDDARWQAATRTHRRQTFRNYVDLGPWPVVSKLDLDLRTRGILLDYIGENSIQVDPRQLYGCLINTQIRHEERVRFNNASLAYLGSFAMRWIVLTP